MKNISKLRDKIMGVPLLCALGGLDAERFYSMKTNPESAAFLCIGPARDLIMGLPIFAAFKYKYPKCKLTLFVSEDNFDIASLSDTIIDTIVKIYIDGKSKSLDIIRASNKFDVWMDFGVWSRFEAILSMKANAFYKIGFKTTGEMRHFAYDRIVEYDSLVHRGDNLFRLASLLGVKVEEIKAEFKECERNNHSKSVIINMFSEDISENSRQWSFENWKTIVEILSKKGYSVGIVGNKENASEADKFIESLSSDIDIAYYVGRLDILGLKKIISESVLVISVDALPLYLAVYLGRCFLGLFGPTLPSGKYFDTDKNGILVSSKSCIGCQNIYGDEKCTIGKPDCMLCVSLEMVEEKILSMLDNVE